MSLLAPIVAPRAASAGTAPVALRGRSGTQGGPALRPSDPGDDALLEELYRTSRADEVAAWGWGETEARAFLQMQWRIQRSALAAQHPDADHAIVMIDGAAIGRLLVERAGECVVLVDVALLPAAQGRGVGTALLTDLIAEAHRRGVPVRLAVVRGSRAERLYRRLGFVPAGEDAARIHMTYDPRIGGAVRGQSTPKPTHGE